MSRQPAQHRALGRARWLFPIGLAVLLALLAPAWCPEPSLAQSGGEDTSQPLRVVIKPLEPFVFVDGAVYRGFSIDLWQEIAARLGWSYEWQLVETVKDQLDAVEQNQADIAITGISITSDREEVVDFSLPYFRAGLQILTRVAGADSVATTTARLWTLLVGSSEFLFVISREAGFDNVSIHEVKVPLTLFGTDARSLLKQWNIKKEALEKYGDKIDKIGIEFPREQVLICRK